jgi:radical SAM superfamily enzyme YgiQ (UPF0313 family)
MSKFRALIVYPNLPMMLVPGIAVGLFTRIFRLQGYDVDLFDTTHYDSVETNYSDTSLNFAKNRVKLLSVRDYSIRKDLGIKVRDANMLADFRTKVEEFQPDFMIFSVVEDTWHQALSMLDAVQDLDIPHLMGGVFPTMAPKVCIDAPQVRLVGPGEGEDTVVAVAEAVRKGESLDGIDGTWFKTEDGEIRKYPARPLVDINRIRPDFSLFENNRFMRPIGGRIFKQIPVETYRGCPYACTYCNSPAQRAFADENDLGSFMRRKSISVLRDELKACIEEHTPDDKNSPGIFFHFVDDSFLARPRQEIFDFCDMYEEFKVPFVFNNRAEQNETDTLMRLKEVGCYRVVLGLEAGNEQYRQIILRRKITNKELIRRFRILADVGLPFSLNVIMGHPAETRELVMDSVELVRAIQGYDAVTCFTFTPYHGTTQRKVAEANGWLDPDTITHHYNSRSLLNMPPPYLSPDEIEGMMMTFPLYCYFPKDEWPNIRRAEKNDEKGQEIRKHYANIYQENFFGETQESEKVYIPGPTSHWGKDPETYFQATPDRLEEDMIARLTLTGPTF